MRDRVLPAVKAGVVIFFPWFFALLGVLSEIYSAVIVTLAAIVYTVIIKDEPNFWLYRLSALAATVLGVIYGLFEFNMIGKRVFLGGIFSGFFYLTALAMLTILLTNDIASVIGTVRKRSERARENSALTQKSPAAAVVICTMCALAAAAFPIGLVLLQNAVKFPSLFGQDRSFPLLMGSYVMPAFIASFYFRLLPKAHKWYIPLSFFVAGIAGTAITWVIFQNVLLQTDEGVFRYYLNNRSYALAAGFTVFAMVPVADFVLLSRNKD